MCIIFTVCSLGLLIFFRYYEEESYIIVTPMVLCTIIFGMYTYIELFNMDLI